MGFRNKKKPLKRKTYEELLKDRDYYLEQMRIARSKLVEQDLVIDDLELDFNKIPRWVQKLFGV